MTFQKICQNCGKPFRAKRQNAKWCSSACKTQGNRKKKGLSPQSDWFKTNIKNEPPVPIVKKELTNLLAKHNEIESILRNDYNQTHNIDIWSYDYNIPSISSLVLKKKREPTSEKIKIEAEIRKLERELNKEKRESSRTQQFDGNEFTKKTRKYKRLRKEIAEKKKDILKIEAEIWEITPSILKKNLQDELIDLDTQMKKLQKEYDKENNILENTVISAEKLKSKVYKTYTLDSEFQPILGTPAIPFTGMIHGTQGSGKSSFMVKFASSFAYKNGDVIYLSLEEGLSETFQKKMNLYDIFPRISNFDIAQDIYKIETIVKNTNLYKLIIIDSLSVADINQKELEKLIKKSKQNECSLFFINHTNKNKDYKGSSGIGHAVDMILKAEEGVIKIDGKNRYQENNSASYKIY